MIPCSESGRSRTKQAANWPFALPAFTRHGVFGINSRSSITSLIAAKNLSRFSPVSAAETRPTTRRTMSAHSSIARPFESFNEYRLLTTFVALSPSCCVFRREGMEGELTVVFDFLSNAALMFMPFSRETFARVRSGLEKRFGSANPSRVPLPKMFGGYPGWLYSRRLKRFGVQQRGPATTPILTSSQAERTIPL